MNLRVVKHTADSEKDTYLAVLKGDGDLNIGCLVEIEIRLKAKIDNVLEAFPMSSRFNVKINAEIIE